MERFYRTADQSAIFVCGTHFQRDARNERFHNAAMNYWLAKSEPETYSWAQLVKDGKTPWTGVRNFAARNHLRAMKVGDHVFFYHSGEAKEIVGLAKVVKAAYPDPTAKEGDWSCVDLAPVVALATPVTLQTIKADKAFNDMPLVKLSRLSVSPVTEAQAKRIGALART
jgi:predicted RNA-binding protein with PUA-like domain